ncbi:formimidoylglutamase [Brachybacterium sp. P6-10-X1]|uniref:formimidoylglutamase n=1 Tax=Brachybacterium sp. P6-10-X1 TaxID=1903186 RepID=UPI000971988B|nr:formimidoylglutamase [Brachybacterium sp. P6-10-X1]APX33400.1 formimidoylglutamase [Brachybacterium sp. P6-10-X1]
MTTSPDTTSLWSGRHDGDGPEHARWHQRVQVVGAEGTSAESPSAESSSAEPPHIALLGFRSDEGVRRNRGRVGAADGPAALRRALAPLALHGPLADGAVGLHDLGDAETTGEDLEGGQARAAALTSAALDRPGARLSVVLGGGHETAWSSYRGLMGSGLGPRAGQRWGVMNLDAHFDLREEPRATSGTPFAQMAGAEQQAGRDLRYAVLGIAEPSNTGTLFARARELGVTWRTDQQCLEAGADGVREFVEEFAAELDILYLTIDMDVLPAATAPGVSAPAAYGVPLPLIAAAVRAAAGSGKLALVDVVELNPSLDADGRTARAAARLIDDAVREVARGDA